MDNQPDNAQSAAQKPHELEHGLVRYADLVPCRTAFIDTRTPGSTEKENFTIIGPGVSESPEQHVHITAKHGFNIGAARQPFGCVNSQHSHETAEVFVVHSGRWRLLFGPNREDGAIEIAHDIDAFVRVGVVADDIPEADVVRDAVRLCVFEDGLQGF